MNYKVEELRFLKMKKVPVYQANPYKRNGLSVFKIEEELSVEEKISFIDALENGVATYLLDLLTKWEQEKGALPQDDFGNPKTVSKKAWIKRNDKRRIIDFEYKIGNYYLFGTKFTKMSTTCPTGEFGYHLEYTDDHIVHQWFHDLLKKLELDERKYFKEHDPFQQKLEKVKDYGRNYRECFGCEELNNMVWNNKEDVPEERVDRYLAAYEELEQAIRKIELDLKFK